MIRGLLQLLLFQGLGELISKMLIPGIPGPVLGLVCLLGYLLIRGKVDEDLSLVGQTFSQHLGILFIPAAVGVVLFIPQLKSHGLSILVVLMVSVALTLLVTAGILRQFSRQPSEDADERPEHKS